MEWHHQMEIDPFLPDGRRCENERPERRVERCPDLGKPGFLVAALRALPNRRAYRLGNAIPWSSK